MRMNGRKSQENALKHGILHSAYPLPVGWDCNWIWISIVFLKKGVPPKAAIIHRQPQSRRNFICHVSSCLGKELLVLDIPWALVTMGPQQLLAGIKNLLEIAEDEDSILCLEGFDCLTDQELALDKQEAELFIKALRMGLESFLNESKAQILLGCTESLLCVSQFEFVTTFDLEGDHETESSRH